ncbi:hypothetical protein ABPG74_002118 [Tetrahymena malaccensis]
MIQFQNKKIRDDNMIQKNQNLIEKRKLVYGIQIQVGVIQIQISVGISLKLLVKQLFKAAKQHQICFFLSYFYLQCFKYIFYIQDEFQTSNIRLIIQVSVRLETYSNDPCSAFKACKTYLTVRNSFWMLFQISFQHSHFNFDWNFTYFQQKF